MRAGKPGRGGYRADLGHYFRSRWEANYARYLAWLKAHHQIADWAYEAETFEFTAIKRGTRFYTPDFRVTERDGRVAYHEVKGWMDPKSATQLKRMARYYPEIPIIVVDRAAYQALRRWARLIPGWEEEAE